MGDGYPTVPESTLEDGGWEQRVREESEVFRTPTSAIIGHTLLYEDAALRRALASVDAAELLAGDGAGGTMIDTGEEGGYWRFFFATALSFRPPLAPGIGPASMRPTVVAEARTAFADDLRARGFDDVERGATQRLRTRSRDRASVAKYTARYPFEDPSVDTLRIEGWLAVWSTGGTFRIAGGAYPTAGLDELLADAEEPPATDPNSYRDDLIELIRAVE